MKIDHSNNGKKIISISDRGDSKKLEIPIRVLKTKKAGDDWFGEVKNDSQKREMARSMLKVGFNTGALGDRLIAGIVFTNLEDSVKIRDPSLSALLEGYSLGRQRYQALSLGDEQQANEPIRVYQELYKKLNY